MLTELCYGNKSFSVTDGNGCVADFILQNPPPDWCLMDNESSSSVPRDYWTLPEGMLPWLIVVCAIVAVFLVAAAVTCSVWSYLSERTKAEPKQRLLEQGKPGSPNVTNARVHDYESDKEPEKEKEEKQEPEPQPEGNLVVAAPEVAPHEEASAPEESAATAEESAVPVVKDKKKKKKKKKKKNEKKNEMERRLTGGDEVELDMMEEHHATSGDESHEPETPKKKKTKKHKAEEDPHDGDAEDEME